jgi:hypothetical protein
MKLTRPMAPSPSSFNTKFTPEYSDALEREKQTNIAALKMLKHALDMAQRAGLTEDHALHEICAGLFALSVPHVKSMRQDPAKTCTNAAYDNR